MGIHIAGMDDIDLVAPMIAKFRVELRGYKNITSEENIPKAKEEFREYIESGYPIYVHREGGEYLGYLVCRI